jgi:hypothetical protein
MVGWVPPLHENDASFYAKERGETTVSGIFGEEFQKAVGRHRFVRS